MIRGGIHMGGPVSAVLLPDALTEGQIARLEAYLHACSQEVVTIEPLRWEFWVANTQPFGGAYGGEGRPFAVALRDAELEPAAEAVLIQTHFGFTPRQTLNMTAFCNGTVDHGIMGILQWHFATVFNGIVDFQGALLPRLPESMYENMWLWEKAHWRMLSPYFNAMVAAMAGKAVIVLYHHIAIEPGRITLPILHSSTPGWIIPPFT
jgi:hypothetical protein